MFTRGMFTRITAAISLVVILIATSPIVGFTAVPMIMPASGTIVMVFVSSVLQIKEKYL